MDTDVKTTDAAAVGFTTEYAPATATRRAALVLRFDDGVELRRYVDGEYKIGRWDARVAVSQISNHGRGASRGSSYVKLRFEELDS